MTWLNWIPDPFLKLLVLLCNVFCNVLLPTFVGVAIFQFYEHTILLHPWSRKPRVLLPWPWQSRVRDATTN
jgi:hypothetical protein